MNLPVPVDHHAPAIAAGGYAEHLERAADLAANAKAPATRAAYRADWERFAAWAAEHDLTPQAATVADVAAYLGQLTATATRSGLPPKPATVSRAVTSLRVAFDRLGRSTDNPARASAVADITTGYRRTQATRGVTTKRARALSAGEVHAMSVAITGTRPADLRNRALLLIGFAGALRRSELAAIRLEHVRDVPEGLVLTIPTSKTDQAGHGAEVPISYAPDLRDCPVRAWQTWTTHLDRDRGPAWPSTTKAGQLRTPPPDRAGAGVLDPRDIDRLVRVLAGRAGVPTAGLSAHSLRAGFITTAARNRATLAEIQAVSRHQSTNVLTGYIRRANPHDGSAATRLWANPHH